MPSCRSREAVSCRVGGPVHGRRRGGGDGGMAEDAERGTIGRRVLTAAFPLLTPAGLAPAGTAIRSRHG